VLVQNAVEFDAMTMDFSLSGAHLRTRRPLKEKASVSIVLYQPHGDLEKYQSQQTIKLTGRIVWQRPDGETYQCGVAYDSFDNAKRLQMQKCFEYFGKNHSF
jgi:c-di-GMP-binding flagellar brake protein YcgR